MDSMLEKTLLKVFFHKFLNCSWCDVVVLQVHFK